MSNHKKIAYKEATVVNEAKRLLNAGEIMVIFDLETTGLNKKTDRILSFSALKMKKDPYLQEVDRIDLFINPGMPIPEVVTKINHINNDTVRDCPKEAEAAKTIRAFLGENPILCGYNSVSFDEGFVQAMYQRVFGESMSPKIHLDVFRLAKEKLDLASYKLSCVSNYLKADADIEFHNSIDDVIATSRCMTKLLDMYEEGCVQKEPDVVKVLAAKFWNGPSPTLKRIYLDTTPRAKIFYDVCREEWSSDSDADLEDIKKQTFALYNVRNEHELFHAVI